MAPFEALYGRSCRSPLCWAKLEDCQMIGPNWVIETTDKIKVIKSRLRTAQSRQKSYVDKRPRPLTFQLGDFVFLRVTVRKGIY